MERLIPITNSLQEILEILSLGASNEDIHSDRQVLTIDLPQIAVVGAQSVGKSSLLEFIIGRRFLPRGRGIVTRRPLILQLQQIKDNQDDYAEFGHKKGKIFTDFDLVRQEIENETIRLIGNKKSVSATPILLRIFSKRVINLTLVDLPGLTKVPVEGQPIDIDIQIRKIVMPYIRRSTCIILAVTAANTDIANSDSLNVAREVDPEGIRTIGVLTKIDIIDDYNNTMQVINNKSYPLRRGYVAVMCRDLKEELSNSYRSIDESIIEEKNYFESNPQFKDIAYRCGTTYLAKMLQSTLLEYIKDSLPQLNEQANKIIRDKEKELEKYGEINHMDILGNFEGGLNNKSAIILNCFSKFSRSFQDMIDGQASYHTGLIKLSGGARLNYIFHNWFGQTLFNFDPLSGLSDSEIRTAIKNSTGTKSSLFVPEGAFEVLARIQIAKLLQPSLTCVEQVYHELKKLVEQCKLPEMMHFYNLKRNITNVVNNLLDNSLRPTNEAIINLINMELAYINTNHPDFIGGAVALSNIFDKNMQNIKLSESNVLDHVITTTKNITNNLNCDLQHINTPTYKQDKNIENFFKSVSEPSNLNLNNVEIDSENGKSTFNSANPYSDNNSSTLFSTISKTLKNIANTTNLNTSNINNVIYNNTTIDHIDISSNTNKCISLKKSVFNQNNNEGKIALPIVPDIVATSEDPSEREKIEAEIIKFFIVSYFNVVRKNIADYVPKAIMYFMVNTIKDSIQRELVTQLYKEELFDTLLKEDEVIIEKRHNCHQYIRELRIFCIN
ncbi:dynamin family protein [Cryptosporidium muris RN66]|uniref:Dynamin family protein n=1 Tax=Cryptosporidium muris (strain RN66) TaxID=441375 RepID=B6AJX3_CRYMR|nr:dynamin family protein [Cryptosporidium muris RN66]EEA08514.1 dynamin family protein [Cryptosporidium muris RN66]|eukprot:XP_002142863.1 dynamin family protein [Cryptosporidium muris RN66]